MLNRWGAKGSYFRREVKKRRLGGGEVVAPLGPCRHPLGQVANFGEKNQASENMICPTLRRGTTVFWGGFWGVFGKKWVRREEMFNCE